MRAETFANSGNLLNSQFTASIPRLKLKLEVGADETLLGALEAAGANPLFNCRNGECGLCAVEVFNIDDAIEHCDVFFHRPREGYCQPTVRRCIPHLRSRSLDRTAVKHR
ncbi:2Fe-2S iron-sulfur cluster-binding protein [Cupriavidus basilensis]|uniref:2Fe-2S iron-sulfur cluster-binding protein n=1 Tax=Cupriavidus basilensis TaxID=68895 RepID=UPI0039F6C7F8